MEGGVPRPGDHLGGAGELGALLIMRRLLPLLACLAATAHLGSGGGFVDRWDGTSVGDLHREYGNIFQHGNRNAASHLWSTFLIERAHFMPRERFLKLAGGYCAVSGSPVDPSDTTRYRMRLPHVDGSGKVTGFMYYCCWPCVCDTQDWIRVDTKTIRTKEGARQYKVAVIGNPCDNAAKLTKTWTDPFSKQTTSISHSAQEVRCSKSGRLKGATLSDHGYPIFSLFFSAPVSFEETKAYKRAGRHFEDAREFDSMCEDRANNGYNSGMGEIFRKVASISTVKVGERGAFRAPRTIKSVAALRLEAERRGLDIRQPGVPTRHRRAGEEQPLLDREGLLELLERTQAGALGKVGTKQLRAVAERRGLLKSGEEEIERPALVARLTRAMTGADVGRTLASDGGSQPELSALNETVVRGMSVKELRKAVVSRFGAGAAKACLEKTDFLALLLPQSPSPSDDLNDGDAPTGEDEAQGNCTTSADGDGGTDGGVGYGSSDPTVAIEDLDL